MVDLPNSNRLYEGYYGTPSLSVMPDEFMKAEVFSIQNLRERA